MADVASLGLAVDSSQVDKGKLSLDQLSNAAKRAQAANDGLATSTKNASAAAVAAARSAYQESVAKTAAARAAENASKVDIQAAMAAQRKAKQALEVAKADHARVAAANAAATASARDAAAALKAAAAYDVEAAAAQKAATATSVRATAVNDNLRRMGGGMSGLAAQFQDIGVTAAMDMNPMLIALQQGTQIAGQLEAAMQGGGSAVGVLGEAFKSLFSPLTFVTIALTALAAAGLQMIDWAGVASMLLEGLAGVLEPVAPYAAMAAAGLALLYAPAIIGGVVSLIALMGRLAVSAGIAAAAMAAANPAAAFVLGVTAAVAAANIFRDELTQIFGVDIVGAAKTGANYVIGSFVAAFEDLKFVWNQFPNIVGAAAVGAANAAISGIESMLNAAAGLLDHFIDKVNGALSMLPGGFSIGKIGAFEIGKIANPYADALSGAVADRNAAVQGALSRDYLGEFGTAISNGASAASGKLKELAGSFTNVEGAAGNAGRAAKDAAEGAKDPWNGLRNAVDRTKEAMSFARDLAGGFLSDLRSGLKQGEGFWASFKNAALNALDKIVDKLLNNVLDALFQVNSAGSGIGGGGGGIGGLLGGIFSIFGFARGGYTGRGGASEVAGVVHGGEYVFSKRATDRIGVGALEQLHRTAKGYANGGHVQPSMPRIQVPAHGNGSPREVIVRVVGEAGPMFIPTIQAESKDVAVQVTQAGIGQYDKQLNRTLGGKIANAQSRQL